MVHTTSPACQLASVNVPGPPNQFDTRPQLRPEPNITIGPGLWGSSVLTPHPSRNLSPKATHNHRVRTKCPSFTHLPVLYCTNSAGSSPERQALIPCYKVWARGFFYPKLLGKFSPFRIGASMSSQFLDSGLREHICPLPTREERVTLAS